ncbi:NADP-dependent oxidoreductase domain-containing protein [Pavlovales sp. CCMP2436]|nr:NADP-dependent oxidoreductase domain-containing protein [Pavlovales sp. CCMP2436]
MLPVCPHLPRMPIVGLGVWKAPPEVTAQVVYDAIKLGYRHLDCACDYGNEEAVGKALKLLFAEKVCTREELWITSKLWNTYHAREHVLPALQRTLDDLGVEYVDLYLIHFPIALQFVPFEKRYPPECQVSNLNVQSVLDVLRYAKVKPACNQIENHLYLTQSKLVDFCHDMEIAVVGFSPLGAASYVGMGLAEANIYYFIIMTFDFYLIKWIITPPPRYDMSELLKLNRNRRFNDPAVYAKGWGEPGSWLAKHGYPLYE